MADPAIMVLSLTDTTIMVTGLMGITVVQSLFGRRLLFAPGIMLRPLVIMEETQVPVEDTVADIMVAVVRVDHADK